MVAKDTSAPRVSFKSLATSCRTTQHYVQYHHLYQGSEPDVIGYDKHVQKVKQYKRNFHQGAC